MEMGSQKRLLICLWIWFVFWRVRPLAIEKLWWVQSLHIHLSWSTSGVLWPRPCVELWHFRCAIAKLEAPKGNVTNVELRVAHVGTKFWIYIYIYSRFTGLDERKVVAIQFGKRSSECPLSTYFAKHFPCSNRIGCARTHMSSLLLKSSRCQQDPEVFSHPPLVLSSSILHP